MGKEIKVRLMSLGRKQMDLLVEIRKRGYPRLQQPQLNAYINGAVTTPQSLVVMQLVDEILTEWERAEG